MNGKHAEKQHSIHWVQSIELFTSMSSEGCWSGALSPRSSPRDLGFFVPNVDVNQPRMCSLPLSSDSLFRSKPTHHHHHRLALQRALSPCTYSHSSPPRLHPSHIRTSLHTPLRPRRRPPPATMEKSRAVIPMLVAMMLLTGVCNTLLTKYQDMQCVADCETSRPKTFEQPVIQTLQMFVGESGCWLVVGISVLLRYFGRGGKGPAYQPVGARDSSEEDGERTDDDEAEAEEANGDMTSSQTLVDPTNVVAKSIIDGEEVPLERRPLEGWKVTLLALPAICDILGTTLMNAGLLLVAASIYQMVRGALVLFVGLFSVLFLKRRLGVWKWASLFVVVLGVAIVGLAGALEKHDTNDPSSDLPGDTQPGGEHDILLPTTAHRALLVIRDAVTTMEAHTAAESVLGVLLIAGAQIFTATQFVLEESIMEKYSMDPIQVVGWEGIFGFSVTLVGMGVLHAVSGRGYFNAAEAFREVFTNRTIAVTSVLIMISIG